jgi:transcriptional regulator of NAD metabolism
MRAWERREKILSDLKKSNSPIKGTELAQKYNVTRQIIVQDVALLRARGENVLATPQGYIIPKIGEDNKIIKKIVCKHSGYDEIEDELRTIVDLGGRIIDVIVEHPVYGEIKGALEISSRLDLEEFISSLRKTNAEPLSSLTEGIHIHTIETRDEESFKRIKKSLKDKGYLIDED